MTVHSLGVHPLEEEDNGNGRGIDKGRIIRNGHRNGGSASTVRAKGNVHGHGQGTTESEMKMNQKADGISGGGEEKEGGFAVPPQRLLVLVPQAIEYRTITGILPANTQRFTFSKKLSISGVVCPSFTQNPRANEQQQESMQEAPGEQNRLYIVQCGTGLVAPSMSIATVVQTVGIDAILLLGSAISLQPKSIKPGHLLLPNSVIQHDLVRSGRNGAIFKTNCKLSEWLHTLITNGGGLENESLPPMYRGTLLSGSEIIRSESRIQYLATCLSTQATPDDGDAVEEVPEQDAVQEEETGNVDVVGAVVNAQETVQNAEREEENGRNGIDRERDGDVEENEEDLYYDEVMAVDRESISVAIMCRRLRIPFVILKTIAPPRFDNEIDFGVYDNDLATFDCNAAIPLVRALLKQYTAFEY